MKNFLIKNNIISGKFKKNNETIVGKWKDGIPHGNIIHTKYDNLKKVILEYRGPFVESGFTKGSLSDNRTYFYEGGILKTENGYYKNGHGVMYYNNVNYCATWEKDKIIGNVSFKIDNKNYMCTVDDHMNPIEGNLYLPDESVFNGKFNYNQLKGTLKFKNGDEFTGKFKYTNGYEFVGEDIKNNNPKKLNPKEDIDYDFPNNRIIKSSLLILIEGKKTFKDGNILEISGKFNSQLKILYKNGTIYEGYIDNYEQKGKFLCLNGDKIVGYFYESGIRGTIFYENGDVFEGKISCNYLPLQNGIDFYLKNGSGCLQTKVSKTIGEWNNDLLHGNGKEIFKKGEIQNCIWVNGNKNIRNMIKIVKINVEKCEKCGKDFNINEENIKKCKECLSSEIDNYF